MEEQYKFVINTCFKHKYQLIFLSDIDVDIFLNECARVFKIPCDKATVELTTRDNAVIPKHQFQKVVENFSTCAYFCIHLNVMSMDISMVTPRDLEEYLISVGANDLLSQRKQTLTEKSRRQLVRHLSNYLELKFGPTSSVKERTTQKEAVAKATIFLFASLKSERTKRGTDIVMGFLNTKQRNDRYTAKKTNENRVENDNDMSTEQERAENDDESENPEQDVQILKATVVNDANLMEICRKLKSTLSYRTKMLKDRALDLLELFPYFFTSPFLIEFEYCLRYPDTNSDAFLDLWPAYSTQLVDVLENQYQTKINTPWSGEIQMLLIFLKLLPARANGRNLLSIGSFNKATEKLFVFRQRGIPLTELVEKNNNFPYIIACGDSEKEVTSFYIELEKQILNVPDDFSVPQVFDLFFKVHKIFNLRFDPNLTPMMESIQQFIFGIPSSYRATPRIKDLFNKLANPIEP